MSGKAASQVRPGIERPTGEHGRAPVLDALDHKRPRDARRADEHLARHLAGLVPHIAGRELRLQLAIDLRHPIDRGVEHRGEAVLQEGAKDLLRLAERVPQQDRDCALAERLGTEGDHGGHDFFRRGHPVLWQPVRGLHDQRFRLPPLRRLAGEPRPQLEVARVEQ